MVHGRVVYEHKNNVNVYCSFELFHDFIWSVWYWSNILPYHITLKQLNTLICHRHIGLSQKGSDCRLSKQIYTIWNITKSRRVAPCYQAIQLNCLEIYRPEIISRISIPWSFADFIPVFTILMIKQLNCYVRSDKHLKCNRSNTLIIYITIYHVGKYTLPCIVLPYRNLTVYIEYIHWKNL